MDTRNGVTDSGSPTISEQGTTRKRCREGWPKACPEQPALSVAEGKPKEANAWSNVQDMLTCLPTGRRGPGAREGKGAKRDRALWQASNDVLKARFPNRVFIS